MPAMPQVSVPTTDDYRLRSLEREKSELQTKLDSMRNSLYLAKNHLNNMSGEHDRAMKSKDGVARDLEVARRRLEEMQLASSASANEVERLRKELEACRSSQHQGEHVVQRMQRDKEDLLHKIEELKDRYSQVVQAKDAAVLEKRLADQEREMSNKQRADDEARHQRLSSQLSEVPTLRRQLNSVTTEKHTVERERSKLEEEVTRLNQQLASLRGEEQSTSRVRTELTENRKAWQEERARLAAELDAAKRRLTSQAAELERATSTCRQHEITLATSSAQYTAIENELATTTSRLQDAERKAAMMAVDAKRQSEDVRQQMDRELAVVRQSQAETKRHLDTAMEDIEVLCKENARLQGERTAAVMDGREEVSRLAREADVAAQHNRSERDRIVAQAREHTNAIAEQARAAQDTWARERAELEKEHEMEKRQLEMRTATLAAESDQLRREIDRLQHIEKQLKQAEGGWQAAQNRVAQQEADTAFNLSQVQHEVARLKSDLNAAMTANERGSNRLREVEADRQKLIDEQVRLVQVESQWQDLRLQLSQKEQDVVASKEELERQRQAAERDLRMASADVKSAREEASMVKSKLYELRERHGRLLQQAAVQESMLAALSSFEVTQAPTRDTSSRLAESIL